MESEVATDYRRSYAALKGMSHRYADRGLAVLGLTTGLAQARAKLATSILKDPAGRWECSSVQIAVEYGFQPITVYVGREFPKGSCGFTAIHDHEMRHADTYRRHARDVRPQIEEVLRGRFADADPLRGPVGTTLPRLQQELDERWLPFLKRQLESVEASQREIDSREEYDRVAASCGGEIARILAATRPRGGN